IVTSVGTVGATAIVPKGATFSPDRNLAAIRPRTGGLRSEVLQYVLNVDKWQELLKTASGSTAQPHLYLGDLRAVPVPLIPLAEQDEIVLRVEALLSLADQVERRVATA